LPKSGGGNAATYAYVANDNQGVNRSQANEGNRSEDVRATERYLSLVCYGNTQPYLPLWVNRGPRHQCPRNGSSRSRSTMGDHAQNAPTPARVPEWPVRVVVRKNVSVQKGETVLFEDIKYFFYITNHTAYSAEKIVALANGRCDQENVTEQLKNGVNAMRMPVDDLLSNWAYMVMSASTRSGISGPCQLGWRTGSGRRGHSVRCLASPRLRSTKTE
jgi:hypothetical protein